MVKLDKLKTRDIITMLVSQNLYKKSSKSQKVRCEICSNYCKIAEDNVGVCRQHKNINGELFDLSYGIVSSLSPDPIEKKVTFPVPNFLITLPETKLTPPVHTAVTIL